MGSFPHRGFAPLREVHQQAPFLTFLGQGQAKLARIGGGWRGVGSFPHRAFAPLREVHQQTPFLAFLSQGQAKLAGIGGGRRGFGFRIQLGQPHPQQPQLLPRHAGVPVKPRDQG